MPAESQTQDDDVMRIVRDVIERMANWRYHHWKCSTCHHEWDGSNQRTCDWCGADGILLAVQSY